MLAQSEAERQPIPPSTKPVSADDPSAEPSLPGAASAGALASAKAPVASAGLGPPSCPSIPVASAPPADESPPPAQPRSQSPATAGVHRRMALMLELYRPRSVPGRHERAILFPQSAKPL